MTTATKNTKQPKPLPAPNSDFYYLYETLNPDELAIVKRVRSFMETKVAPVITKYWVEDAFPFELLPALKELGIGGLGMKGYGCAGGSLALLGFVQMEIARIDPSFATFFGVHDGLAMGSIYIDGSEEQKQKWLPPMARMDKIGCFGLTEPLVGSGASGGRRRRDTGLPGAPGTDPGVRNYRTGLLIDTRFRSQRKHCHANTMLRVRG
jgi:alkylation response protein AidB-like acyl-CoA dehydrogenase